MAHKEKTFLLREPTMLIIFIVKRGYQKRLLYEIMSLFFFSISLVLLLLISHPTLSQTPDGDVAPLGNRDGTVNVGDALVALRFALTLDTPTQEDIAHGDVAPLDAQGQPSPDGVINVGDALVILRKALGLISFSVTDPSYHVAVFIIPGMEILL